METVSRLLGSGLAAAGTLFQLAVIAATIPDFRSFPPCLHCGYFEPFHLPGWTPFIENLGEGSRSPKILRCPGRQVEGTSFRLDHAPLPPGFRPFDYEETVLACVRVDSEGSIGAVKLMAGTGKPALDRQLIRTIGRQWRFSPQNEVQARPGWQRIRLSTGPSYPAN